MAGGLSRFMSVDIIKTDGDVPVPFFLRARVWSSRCNGRRFSKGALVAEMEIFDPVINFVSGPTEETLAGGRGQAVAGYDQEIVSRSISIALKSTTAVSIIATFTAGPKWTW